MSIAYISNFMDTIDLPNGMAVRREFDFNDLLHGRSDLYSANGKLLASGITYLCFDDHLVKTKPHGNFDINSISPIPGTRDEYDYLDFFPACDGYFVISLPPEYFYNYSPGVNKDGLDICNERNFRNLSLTSIEWMVGPCPPFPPRNR